jgi:hypothetical protein
LKARQISLDYGIEELERDREAHKKLGLTWANATRFCWR